MQSFHLLRKLRMMNVLSDRFVAYRELHRLGSRRPQLPRHHNLAPLRSTLHDKPQYTIARPPDRQAIQQLVPQALALRHSTQPAILHLCRVERHGVLWELESLLNKAGEFADAATLLAKDILGVRGADDDIGDGRSDTDFDAGVAFLGEFALEKFVEFGVEDAVRDELALLGTVGCLLVIWSGEESVEVADLHGTCLSCSHLDSKVKSEEGE